MKRSKRALILIGHGSKLKGFERPMEKVARDLRGSAKFDSVLCAYLEITPPSIEDAVAQVVKGGATDVSLLPYFLLKGRHTQEDIPAIAKNMKKRHKKTKIKLCPYLGYHKKIAQAALERASS